MQFFDKIHAVFVFMSYYYTSLIAVVVVIGMYLLSNVPICIAAYLLLFLSLYVNYKAMRNEDVDQKLRFFIQSLILLSSLVFLFLSYKELVFFSTNTRVTIRESLRLVKTRAWPKIFMCSLPIIFSLYKSFTVIRKIIKEYRNFHEYSDEVIIKGKVFKKQRRVPNGFIYTVMGLMLVLLPFNVDKTYCLNCMTFMCGVVMPHIKFYDSRRNAFLASTCLLLSVAVFVSIFGFNKAFSKVHTNLLNAREITE